MRHGELPFPFSFLFLPEPEFLTRHPKGRPVGAEANTGGRRFVLGPQTSAETVTKYIVAPLIVCLAILRSLSCSFPCHTVRRSISKHVTPIATGLLRCAV